MSSKMKRERGDTLHTDERDIKRPSGITISSSESTQSSIKFEKCVYNTLLNLNNQMSCTLCGGVKDINDVCFKIMECLHEIEKQDHLYQKMRRQHSSSSFFSLMKRSTVEMASCTTMTEEEKEVTKKTKSIETDVKKSATDQVVQCSFVCELPTAFEETQSMQHAFKECLQAFIKDVEDVSSVYVEEAKKISQSKSSASIMEIVNDDDAAKSDDEKIGSGYVCKCKAVHNLHEKLIKQVEACDSFCEFQKRMAHNVSVINGKKDNNCYEKFCCYHRRLQKATENASTKVLLQKTEQQEAQPPQEKRKNLASKYSDSLWFTWKPKKNTSTITRKSRGHWRKPKLSVENTTIVSTSSTQQTLNNENALSRKVDETKPLLPPPPPPPKQPSPTSSDYDTWNQYNTGHLTRASKTLNCVDILEELTENDVRPIHSEYPRRDDTPPPPPPDPSTALLEQLVYGRNNRNILEILSSLEQPKVTATPGEKFSLTGGDSDLLAAPRMRIIRPPSATPLSTNNSDKFATKRTWCTPPSPAKSNNNADKFATTAPKKLPKSGGDKLLTKKSSSVASAPPKRPRAPKVGQKGGAAAEKAKKKVKGKSLSDYSPDLKEKKRTNDKVVSKLQKYINDPHLRYRTTITTVMPVRVYHHPNPLTLHNGGDSDRTPLKKPSPTRKFSSPTTSPRDNSTTLNTKKLWANKYQKSVCQHLVSFIERQEPHPLTKQQPHPSKRRVAGNSKPRSAPPVKKVASTMSPARTKMLSSMGVLASIDRKGLEANIQKIIDMIELKIIDIIGDPQKQNAATFAEIETEITGVLGELRAMGAAPAPVHKIRRNDLKLTALETILDLEMVGDSVMNMLKKDTPKSHMVTDLLATSEDSVEEKCVVTSACAPEKNALTTVSSQNFLTPFMQELKKHRQASTGAGDPKKKASYHNVLQFLDSLTNIQDDYAIVLFYRDLLGNAEVWQQAHVSFLKELTCSVRLLSGEDTAAILYGVADKMAAIEAQQYNREIVLVAAAQAQKAFAASQQNKAKYLHQLYGVLFTLMYFALTFDYDCA